MKKGNLLRALEKAFGPPALQPYAWEKRPQKTKREIVMDKNEALWTKMYKNIGLEYRPVYRGLSQQ